MPNDTLWLNSKGNYIILDSSGNISREDLEIIAENYRTNPESYNDENGKSIVSYSDTSIIVTKGDKVFNQSQFDKDVAFYNKIGYEINFMILGLFCYAIYYAIKRLRRKQKYPLEEDSGWVELGSRNNGKDAGSDW